MVASSQATDYSDLWQKAMYTLLFLMEVFGQIQAVTECDAFDPNKCEVGERGALLM
jgi:hypothetical protein